MYMKRITAPFGPRYVAAAALVATAAMFGAAPTQAMGVPGVDLYLGAGLGQSNADVSAHDLGAANFDKKDLGWKVFVGGRFASLVGAELDYIDFGKPNGDYSNGDPEQIKYNALAGFGLVYFPIPLPVLDVYAKAGLARLSSDRLSTAISTKDTKFAFGGGVQLKFGSFAIRGEYEQYKVQDASPTMLTIGFSKSFL